MIGKSYQRTSSKSWIYANSACGSDQRKTAVYIFLGKRSLFSSPFALAKACPRPELHGRRTADRKIGMKKAPRRARRLNDRQSFFVFEISCCNHDQIKNPADAEQAEREKVNEAGCLLLEVKTVNAEDS